MQQRGKPRRPRLYGAWPSIGRWAPLVVALAVALGGLGFLVAEAPAQVTLYEHENLRGDSRTFESTVNDLDVVDFSDEASSASNDGATASLYDDRFAGAICMNLDQGELQSFSGTLLPEDSVSRVQLNEVCGGQFIFYQDTNFNSSGDHSCVFFECLLNSSYSPGEHFALQADESISDFGDYDFDNDADSIAVPYGGMAAVYSEPNFQGACSTITVDEADLGTRVVGGDAVSSVKGARGCDDAVYLFIGPRFSGHSCHICLTPYADVRQITAEDLPDTGIYRSVNNVLPGHYVNLYAGRYFSGDCEVVSGFGERDTSFASMTITKKSCPDAAVYLYPNTNYAGGGVRVEATAPNLSDPDSNSELKSFENQARSVVNATDQHAALYVERNHVGRCVTVAPRSALADLTASIGTATVSSVTIGAPCALAPVIHTQVSLSPPSYRDVEVTADIANFDPEDAAYAISNFSNGPVALYRDTNFVGVCQNVPPSASWYPLDGGVVGYRTVSSVAISAPCPEKILLFGQVGYGGVFLGLADDTPDLTVFGFADRASSLVNNTSGVVSVYSTADYRGRCQNVEPGEAISNLVGSGIGDDSIAAVRIGRSCPALALLYGKVDFGGAFLGVAVDTADLGTNGFSNRTSSIVNNTEGTISVYSKTSYTGRCQNVPANTAVSSLVGSVVHDDAVQSIKVSGRCPRVLLLFKRSGFSGGALRLARSNLDLRNTRFDDSAVSLANNTVVPVAVYTNPGGLGLCQTIEAGEAVADLSADGNRVGPQEISSVKFNSRC